LETSRAGLVGAELADDLVAQMRERPQILGKPRLGQYRGQLAQLSQFQLDVPADLMIGIAPGLLANVVRERLGGE
jgi:hypothetical protein